MSDRGLCAVGDDEIVGAAAARDDRVPDRVLQTLARERFRARDEPALTWLGSSQQLGSGAHARLGSALGATDTRQLVVVLCTPAGAEQAVIGLQLDARCAEPVGEVDRKLAGHARAVERELLAGTNACLHLGLVALEPTREQLVDSECLK